MRPSPCLPTSRLVSRVTLRFIFRTKPTSPVTVDPWAGSYYVESLTNEIVHKAWEHIQEIEKLGGMAKAIETGIPKMRIEEAAARTQARIDSGHRPSSASTSIVWLKEAPIDILEMDNTEPFATSRLSHA
jgi:methylmalonyl-CoA mutase N-terminal domain/subunit